MPAFIGMFQTSWQRTGRMRHVPRTVGTGFLRSANVMVLQVEQEAMRYPARCPNDGPPPANARRVTRWVDATMDDVLPVMGVSAAVGRVVVLPGDEAARKSA